MDGGGRAREKGEEVTGGHFCLSFLGQLIHQANQSGSASEAIKECTRAFGFCLAQLCARQDRGKGERRRQPGCTAVPCRGSAGRSASGSESRVTICGSMQQHEPQHSKRRAWPALAPAGPPCCSSLRGALYSATQAADTVEARANPSLSAKIKQKRKRVYYVTSYAWHDKCSRTEKGRRRTRRTLAGPGQRKGLCAHATRSSSAASRRPGEHGHHANRTNSPQSPRGTALGEHGHKRRPRRPGRGVACGLDLALPEAEAVSRLLGMRLEQGANLCRRAEAKVCSAIPALRP